MSQILATTEIDSSDLNWNDLPPNFRRATKSMILATLAIEKTLTSLPVSLAKENVSVVFASHVGEFQATLDFLGGTFPSPILFQNSLHNSILGFVSVALGLTGPTLTVSTAQLTEQSAKDVCESLLALTPYVILCLVDAIPESFLEIYADKLPYTLKYNGKARCILYGKD